jgi:hypothetical protein
LLKIHPLGEKDEELQQFIDTYLPLEKLASRKSNGDRVYLEHLGAFRHKLVGINHPEEQIQSHSGLRQIDEHRIGDSHHHIGSLHILLSVLKLRETARVKNWQDAEKWIFRRVSQILENNFGTVVTGPLA